MRLHRCITHAVVGGATQRIIHNQSKSLNDSTAQLIFRGDRTNKCFTNHIMFYFCIF